MLKKIIFTLLPSLLLSSIYPHFTDKDYINIEKKYGKISKNRSLDYQKNINLFKSYSGTKQLNSVNRYLNQLLPQYDGVIQKQEDYWATPKEFLTTGYGDCEDYVIIKYFTLIKLGFDKKKLFLTTVYEKYTGSYHMVLSYFKEKNKAPLILDNLSFRILDLQTRTDIQVDYFLNEQGIFKINNKYELKKIKNHSSEYLNLMKKVKKDI